MSISSINTNTLSQLYRSQGQDYSTLVSKIGSGKEIRKASDNFIGFTRANNLTNDISGIDDINTNLVELKGAAQMASDVGNNLLEDLGRMKELEALDGTGTAEDDAVYQAEFDALAASVADTLTDAKYEGNAVITDTAITGASAAIDLAGTTLDLDFSTATSADGLLKTAAALGGLAAFGADAGELDDAIEAVTAYTVTAEGYSGRIDRQIEINENLISNKEETRSALVDLDEVKAIQQATELQVRQQATVSMIAQANLMSGGVARLYS